VSTGFWRTSTITNEPIRINKPHMVDKVLGGWKRVVASWAQRHRCRLWAFEGRNVGRAEEGAAKLKTPRIIFAPPAHGLFCPRSSPPGVCSRAVEGAKLDKIELASAADIRIGPNFLLGRTPLRPETAVRDVKGPKGGNVSPLSGVPEDLANRVGWWATKGGSTRGCRHPLRGAPSPVAGKLR
jgi:hypothetical protein